MGGKSMKTSQESASSSGSMENKTLCSVLNVTIDHTMEKPSPLEPDEWTTNERHGEHLRVPVVRVFGPVLRSTRPVQSGCLYIHGVFPYLLARPVWAGPDGSIKRQKPQSGQVDWDSYGSVERIAEKVATTLESTIKSLDSSRNNDGNDNNNNDNNFQNNETGNDHGTTNKDETAKHPVIRKITVVEGRGFFTYCPGPSAPFLRVEYYNPKLRWKVKMVLERGLEVPMSYHPDPTIYDRPPEPPPDVLKFHCYEAHIPYTMQFFKDYNLAGMSYIHVTRGVLRGSLPAKSQGNKYPTNAQSKVDPECSTDDGTVVDSRDVFLQSNTPVQFLWEKLQENPFLLKDIFVHPTKPVLLDEAFVPPKKSTSCDVEVDCSVQDLRNVETVLKTLPSDQDERDRIQWRAVPSLQEIWRQERRRMARLLPPKHDFLSHPIETDDNRSQKSGKSIIRTPQRKHPPQPPPFTLNVKEGASRPGSRLAAKGMWSLVAQTHGLQEEFARALNQIILRHRHAIEEVEEGIKQQQQLLQNEQQKHEQQQEQLLNSDEKVSPSSSSAKQERQSPCIPPSWDEAIEALATMRSRGVSPQPSARGMNQNQRSIQDGDQMLVEEKRNGQNRYFEEKEEQEQEEGSLPNTPKKGFSPSNSTEEENRSSSMSPTWDEAIEALESMRAQVDNSESPDPTGTHDGAAAKASVSEDVDSSNNSTPNNDDGNEKTPPHTYRSSQDIHDENSSLIKSMDPIDYSQRVERGDSIVDGLDGALEESIDPETLLPYEDLEFSEDRCRAIFRVDADPPGQRRVCGCIAAACQREGHRYRNEIAAPGCYQTISTGIHIDGILLKGADCIEDTDEDNKEDFERLLTQLATNQESRERKEDSAVLAYSEKEVNFERNSQHVNICNDHSMSLENSVQSSPSASEDDHSVDNPSSSEKHPPSPSDNHQNSSSEEGSSDQMIEGQPIESIVSPKMLPPTLGEVKYDDQALLALPSNQHHPPGWLVHAAAYTSSQEHRQMTSGMGRGTGDSFAFRSKGSYVYPVLNPPTRRKVISWFKKASKETSNPRKRKRDAPMLEIDANSRKIVAAKSARTTKMDNSASVSLEQQDIEEVHWQLSQAYPLTMSPLSQPEPEVKPKSTGQSADGTAFSKSAQYRSPARVSTLGSSKRHENDGVQSTSRVSSQASGDALDGIGQQGCRIQVQGGGGLKAKAHFSPAAKGGSRNGLVVDASSNDRLTSGSLPTPVSYMAIEIHVQCRSGSSRLDSKKIAMVPNSSQDSISAVSYVYGVDPGGGQSLTTICRGCLFIPVHTEQFDCKVQTQLAKSSMRRDTVGKDGEMHVECVVDEKSLLLRFASIVRVKDPDMLLSWDSQGSGLGYIIERGLALGNAGTASTSDGVNQSSGVDMVRLLGRTPQEKSTTNFLTIQPTTTTASAGGFFEQLGNTTSTSNNENQFRGSGLGSDWDERVGAGAAAASITGRLVFAAWKLVAEEVKHPNASYLPAMVATVLNKRLPHHDDLTLTNWYASRTERWRVLNHRLRQAAVCMALFDALDIIGRAGEAARLSGVEFSQSFPGIRGSQYKVEGVLLRALQSLRSDERGSKLGKKNESMSMNASDSQEVRSSANTSASFKSQSQSPWKLRRGQTVEDGMTRSLESRHYFFYSPSLHDTNRQEALEVQALTLEPQSGHYKDPVVVCDFTALYPSLVIAYNLCYSTCIGRLEYHSTRGEMRLEGRTSGRIGPFKYPERRTATALAYHFKSVGEEGYLQTNWLEASANDRGYIAPTGTMYVSEDVLKGVLPRVLDELLTTRAMLKKAAKEYKKHVKGLSPSILRQLEARQLALKYVANVTYGYTSATFSGRCAMPLLADTIVECGRKTLRKAINLANRWGRESGKWKGCSVIYGDTDSLFVKLPGRSYHEAFEFGEELCKAVTADNPPPIQLKLEKVYLGSIMQTMKRYCGMKFESKHQKKPVFEAKGLETVRRDQCSLTQKVLRNALITLFRYGIERVKEYLFRQWSRIFAGALPISDFILTGRVRSRYRGGGEGPVQAVLARRMAEADPGRIVRHKERVPYIIVATPGVTFRLKHCVLTPMELLERWDAYTVHSAYYIEKHVNASLQRCFGLAPHFVNINEWYQTCPKPRRRTHFWPVRSRNRAMITSYFGSDVCSLCQRVCQASGRDRVVVCQTCRANTEQANSTALTHLNNIQQAAHDVARQCSKCNHCFESAETFASTMPSNNDNNKNKNNSGLFFNAASGNNGFNVFNNNGSKDTPAGSKSLMVPLSNCVCIDCPNTFRRHRLRELEIEAVLTCKVLDLL